MSRKLVMLVACLCLPYLGGCTAGPPNKQNIGMVTGGVLGGVVGSRFGGGSGQLWTTAAGTIAGAVLGSSIGQSMDAADQLQWAQSLEHNEVGQPSYWHNAHTGVKYRVVPVHNMKIKRNPYCREYRTTAMIGVEAQELYGTACRNADGSWYVVDKHK